ncbi:hypothetical protein DRO38_08035 [Candidatus Bathyarchaeota archaeon]|nr:MAG: hypothetical protein DRO38_08035 [Candidatus Bathyarchaeota archaeon]
MSDENATDVTGVDGSAGDDGLSGDIDAMLEYVSGAKDTSDDSSENKKEDPKQNAGSDDTDDNDSVKDVESKSDSDSDSESDVKAKTSVDTKTDEDSSSGDDKSPDDEDKSDDDSKLTELEQLKVQNEKLMKMVNDLASGKGISVQDSGETKTAQTKQTVDDQNQSKPEDDKTEQDKETDLFEEVSYLEIMDSEDSFKAFVNKLTERIQNKTTEAILKAIPQVVTSHTSNVLKLQKQVDSFYSENPALKAVKPLVGATVNQVMSEHPEWDSEKTLNEAGKRVYDAIGLKKEAIKNAVKDEKKKQRPAFANANSGRKPSGPVLEGIQKEIDEMLSFVQ